jgi:hypothetical protein
MYKIFRLWTAAVAVVLLTQPLLIAQTDEPAPDPLEEWQRNELNGLVDAVGAAVRGELVQTDDDLLKFQASYLKGAGGDTYVPFTVRVDPSKVNKSKVLMYLFVVPRDRPPVVEPAEPADPADPADPAAAPASEWYDGAVFDDAFFVDVPDDRTASGEIELQRAFSAPGGDVYNVYLAIRDSIGAGADAAALAESLVMMAKDEIDVPDLWNAGLQTSTVIIAEAVEPLEQPLTPDEQIANPFTLGGTRIIPKQDRDFAKDDEFSLIMLVYNPQLGADQMPDVTINYDFHLRTDSGEEFFNRTNPQQFNAQTLPPGFDIAAGHQVVAGQSVPLGSFPAGNYRLEITVTDNVSGGDLAREVIFDIHE